MDRPSSEATGMVGAAEGQAYFRNPRDPVYTSSLPVLRIPIFKGRGRTIDKKLRFIK